MNLFHQRRSLLLALASAPFAGSAIAAAQAPVTSQSRFAELERGTGGRLGIAAIDTGSGRQIDYRSSERFPLCSTCKIMVTSAILSHSANDEALLQRRLKYPKSELVANSPVTEKNHDKGMTVAELCAAAMQYSDNTATNLLLKVLGGPAAVTAYARTIGDSVFRLDRRETMLNTAIPGDERDTSTPLAMMLSLRKLGLGEALGPAQQERLQQWMLGCTTGAEKIRAGVAANWKVGDKSGGGAFGTTNDVALLWPPGREPIVLAVYFTQPEKDAKTRNDVVAAATKLSIELLA
ncbi:MAG TPA: class A beta-lactamase [Janthinobacterium sp.]|nr:class A beta-lactamase [Janthinobacterium sp.]